MVKVTIDEDDSEPLSDEERDEIEAVAARNVADHPEEFQKSMDGVKEVIIPRRVVNDMKRAGVSVEDLVSMILRGGRPVS